MYNGSSNKHPVTILLLPYDKRLMKMIVYRNQVDLICNDLSAYFLFF